MLSTPLHRLLAYRHRQWLLPSILFFCASPARRGMEGPRHENTWTRRGTRVRLHALSATAARPRPGAPAELQPRARSGARSRGSPGSSQGNPQIAARQLRGACAGPPPPAGACASPASCWAAAVPPRCRAAAGLGLGQSRSVPPHRPSTPAGPGHGGGWSGRARRWWCRCRGRVRRSAPTPVRARERPPPAAAPSPAGA